MANLKLTPEVRSVLERSTITSSTVTLPAQLDRDLYDAVNKVITLAGGKWVRRAQCHVFIGDPREKLGLALETGEVVDEKKKYQFFPTPKELAARVVDRADVSGKTVLEPSAGHGALAVACLERGAKHIDCVEINPDAYRILNHKLHLNAQRKGSWNVHCCDFLGWSPSPIYDRVVMNPPFTKGQDLKHIQQAIKFLRPGGLLVAITLPHTEDELYDVFDENDYAHWHTEEIEAGSFKESGTDIKTMMLVLEKSRTASILPAQSAVDLARTVSPPQPQPTTKSMPRIIINSRRPAPPPLPSVALAKEGRHTGIAPANLQAVLDSAPNAGQKGQAAWFCPPSWAEALALALPGYRPVTVDLTCGNGQLLMGARAPGTYHLLGCDIEALTPDPEQLMGVNLASHFIQADITELAAYLHKAQWTADCFVLNFPFDHHWYRDRLAFLKDSDCWTVSTAFEHHDGRTREDTIDSTAAGMMLALDRMAMWGEGFVIANHSTVERLLFAKDAPHEAIASHVWCRLTVPFNICDGKEGMATDVLYFARAHFSGMNKEIRAGSLAEAAEQLKQVGQSRLSLRAGTTIRQYEGGHTANTVELWDAIGLEWRTVHNQNRSNDRRWNVWLNLDGTLDTNLTPFQEVAEPIKKEQYLRLHALKGKHPMQLILQKAERRELHHAVFGTTWRVAPAVIEAVQAALKEYDEVRAPLYPLSKIQRLGYLDDNDDILCLKEVREDDMLSSHSQRCHTGLLCLFTAGQRYTIRTETIAIKRTGRKMNLTGQLDDVLWEGSELALFIKDNNGAERLFMDERLRAEDVRLSIQAEDAPSPIEFNLQQLADHFEIPEVPDVATKNPEGYQRNLALLKLIENIVNSANQN